MNFTKKPWAGSLSPMQFDTAVKTVSHVLDEQFSVRLKPTRAQHVTASILGYQSLQQAQHALSDPTRIKDESNSHNKAHQAGWEMGKQILEYIESEKVLQRHIMKAAEKSDLADYALQWEYESREDNQNISTLLITSMIAISYIAYHYAVNSPSIHLDDEIMSLVMSPYEHEHVEDIGAAERLIFDAVQTQFMSIQDAKVELFVDKEKREFNYDSDKFIEAFSNREIAAKMAELIQSFGKIDKLLSSKIYNDYVYVFFKGMFGSIFARFITGETVQEVEVPVRKLRANATFIRFIVDMPRKHLKTAMKANQQSPFF